MTIQRVCVDTMTVSFGSATWEVSGWPSIYDPLGTTRFSYDTVATVALTLYLVNPDHPVISALCNVNQYRDKDDKYVNNPTGGASLHVSDAKGLVFSLFAANGMARAVSTAFLSQIPGVVYPANLAIQAVLSQSAFLFDSRTGDIVHTHRFNTVQGGQAPDLGAIEGDARGLAKEIGQQNVDQLDFVHSATPMENGFDHKIDLKSKQLIKVGPWPVPSGSIARA